MPRKLGPRAWLRKALAVLLLGGASAGIHWLEQNDQISKVTLSIVVLVGFGAVLVLSLYVFVNANVVSDLDAVYNRTKSKRTEVDILADLQVMTDRHSQIFDLVTRRLLLNLLSAVRGLPHISAQSSGEEIRVPSGEVSHPRPRPVRAARQERLPMKLDDLDEESSPESNHRSLDKEPNSQRSARKA